MTSRTYFTLHFDETTTSQIKKQFDILVKYYSDNYNEVRVRFLKVAVFGHVYAESLANELCETFQKFSLPLKYLLLLSSDGPNVNKAIKANINSKLKANYQRELVDTGPCQLQVVHNSFRKGVEGYGSDVENLCIDICRAMTRRPPFPVNYASWFPSELRGKAVPSIESPYSSRLSERSNRTLPSCCTARSRPIRSFPAIWSGMDSANQRLSRH